MNIVIFGTGWYADEILMSQKILDKYGWKISGFLDNNEKKWGGKNTEIHLFIRLQK